jgi:predicted ATPase
MEAHYALGVPLMLLGEFALARTHFERSLGCYDPRQHRSRAFLYGQNPVVGCLSVAAWTLWFLGYPEQALKKSDEAITLAHELSPSSLVFALGFAAWLHHFRRDRQAAQERAERLIALSREQGFSFWLAQGTFQRGLALVEQEHEEEEMPQTRQGLAAWQATGAEAYGTQFFTMLAEACGRVGQAEEGLSVLAKTLILVAKIGEHYYEAELYRLKGELTLAQSRVQSLASRVKKSSQLKVQSSKSKNTDPRSLTPDPQSEAEACFLQAIEIARHQQAKSLELRATMSLARLGQRQGKTQQAHIMLSEVYNWFTEGFDTKDLQEAKALIEELSH